MVDEDSFGYPDQSVQIVLGKVVDTILIRVNHPVWLNSSI